MLLQTGEHFPQKEPLLIKMEAMEYQAETPSGYIQKVNFTLHLNTGEAMIGSGYFDTIKKVNKMGRMIIGFEIMKLGHTDRCSKRQV